MRNLFYQDNLEFEIYVIGYAKQGESILFLVKTDNRVQYCGIVDYYRTNSADFVKELLNKLAIDRIDFLCWTHPHEDHTRGLDYVIDNYCDEKTSICITDIMPADYKCYSKDCVSVYKKINQIHKLKSKNKPRIKYAKDSTLLEQVLCAGIRGDYNFSIRSFAPSSTLIAENRVWDKIEKGNLYSIGLIINIGHFSILLGGDVENHTIDMLEDFELDCPLDYIKIPHHGSESSISLITRFERFGRRAPSMAVSTVYRSGNLPAIETFERYRIWGVDKIYCTGDVVNPKQDKEKVGIVRTVFDVLEKKEVCIETYIDKNATIVFES